MYNQYTFINKTRLKKVTKKKYYLSHTLLRQPLRSIVRVIVKITKTILVLELYKNTCTKVRRNVTIE